MAAVVYLLALDERFEISLWRRRNGGTKWNQDFVVARRGSAALTDTTWIVSSLRTETADRDSNPSTPTQNKTPRHLCNDIDGHNEMLSARGERRRDALVAATAVSVNGSRPVDNRARMSLLAALGNPRYGFAGCGAV